MSSKPLILMYHGIVGEEAVMPSEREDGAELYDVPAVEFRKQMEYLKSSGKKIGTTWQSDAKDLDVILTFDDGEKNNFSYAFPVLQEMGFKAYMFITPDRIEKEGYMNWEEVMELRDANIIIGSHGMTHRMLTELKDSQMEQELLESKDILEQHLKIEIKDVSIPRGFYNAKVLDAVKRAGYKNIFVSEKNNEADPVLERVAVKSDWSLGRFKTALSGKTPVGEAAFNAIKGSVKNVAGGTVYNKIRSAILKVKKK